MGQTDRLLLEDLNVVQLVKKYPVYFASLQFNIVSGTNTQERSEMYQKNGDHKWTAIKVQKPVDNAEFPYELN